MARYRTVASNAGESGGLRQLTEGVADKMAAFDALPPRLRDELNYAAIEFSPLDALRLLRRDIAVRAIIAGIRATVAEIFATQRRALARLRVSLRAARPSTGRAPGIAKDTVRA